MTTRGWTKALPWVFVAAVAFGVWWSWRSSGAELSSALHDIGAARTIGAATIVLGGLTITGAVWVVALHAFAPARPVRVVVAHFFVAQLGKYVPGSVWSVAAQGMLASGQGVPARTTVTAIVLFLGVHTASGLLLVGVLGWWTQLPMWLVLLSLLGGAIGVVPAGYRALGSRLARADCSWNARRSATGAALMTLTWCAYGTALMVLAPQDDLSGAITLGCAFVLAFTAGVAIPFAPAGLGAREGVMVALLAPSLGVGPAGALAIAARLVHTLADLAAAGLAWVALRSVATGPGGARPDDH